MAPIGQMLDGLVNIGEINWKVADILDENGNWDTNRITTVIPRTVVEENTPTPLFRDHDDVRVWGGTTNGLFSCKSAFHFLNNNKNHMSRGMELNWKWIWKFKCSERIKFFIWICLHNSLATNVLRYERGLTDTNLCQRCNNYPETILHTLRDCVDAKEVWEYVISPTQFLKFRRLSSEVFDNIISPNTPWPLMFASLLWSIWKARNKFIFRNVKVSMQEVVLAAKRLAFNLVSLFSEKGGLGIKLATQLNGKCPTNGWFKINTDGSFIASQSRATTGGLIRNDLGEWVIGFARKLGNVSITTAELLAAREGLKITWDRRLPKIILEVDSEVVVKLIRDADVDLHPLGNVIQDCSILLGMPWESRVTHTLRSGNCCADALAAKGHIITGCFEMWMDPPLDTCPCERRCNLVSFFAPL